MPDENQSQQQTSEAPSENAQQQDPPVTQPTTPDLLPDWENMETMRKADFPQDPDRIEK